MQKADKFVRDSLQDDSQGSNLSPAAVNVLMSAHAWKGNVGDCMTLLDQMSRSDLSPDMNSYCFALESVGKTLRRLVQNTNLRISNRKRQSLLETWVTAVDEILTRLEETPGLSPNNHFIRNYVEFLCILGEVDTANQVTIDFLRSNNQSGGPLVDNKTLSRVAVANAEVGNFDKARAHIASLSESLPFLEIKIANMQERAENGEANPASGQPYAPPPPH